MLESFVKWKYYFQQNLFCLTDDLNVTHLGLKLEIQFGFDIHKHFLCGNLQTIWYLLYCSTQMNCCSNCLLVKIELMTVYPFQQVQTNVFDAYRQIDLFELNCYYKLHNFHHKAFKDLFELFQLLYPNGANTNWVLYLYLKV